MEKKRIKLSIIVPVYNVKDYLAQCLESLLAQSFKDYEIILVDDGSIDGCGKICDEFADRYACITALHKENGGLSSARNYGMQYAGGEYYGFVDSDDWIEPEMYEKLISSAILHNADVTCCGVINYDDSTQKNSRCLLKEERETVYTGMNAKTELYKNFSVCNKLYRAELFDEIRFPEGKLYEDARTMYRIASKVETYAVCPYYGYFYRHRSTSIMGTFAEDRYLDRVHVWTEIYEGMEDALPPEELQYILYRRDLLTIELLKSMMVQKRFFARKDLVAALAENLTVVGWRTENTGIKDKCMVFVAKALKALSKK